MTLRILNGHLLDPGNQIDAKHDLYIEHGKIVAIDQQPEDFVAEQTLDANGLIICPGLIDLSARLSG